MNSAARKPWTKRPDAPRRLSGRKAVERRARWLAKFPLCKACEEANPPRVTLGDVVDHIINLAAGGADDESNFQTLCTAHHDEKTIRERGHEPRPPKLRIGLDGWPVG